MAFSNRIPLDKMIFNIAWGLFKIGFWLSYYTLALLCLAFIFTCLFNPLLAIALVPSLVTTAQVCSIFALGMGALLVADALLTAIFAPHVTYIPIRFVNPANQQAMPRSEPMPQALHVPDGPSDNLTDRFNSTLKIIERLVPNHGITVIEDFKCGISQDIMSEPIAATDNTQTIHYYDRNQLRLYYQTEMNRGKRLSNITDPISRQPIIHLARDEGLRHQIADYLQTLETDFRPILSVAPANNT